jgi:predicted dienelactone hydrolase
VLFERPDDVRAAVDEAIRRSEEGDARLGGMVDGRTWAAVGHSFGAFTVMALGGGRVAWEALAGHCATEGGVICDALDAFDPADGAGHGTSDERVVATVPLAPGVWYAFGEDGRGLSEVRAPLVLGGDKDDVLPYTTEIRPSYEAMTAPKRMGTLADAGHYAFSDICEAAPFLFDDCEEESGGFLDIATAHDITNTLVTAFLGVKLARDGRYAPWIVEDLARTWPALRWEVED